MPSLFMFYVVILLFSYNIVPQESVLELRSCLDEIQKAKGLAKDEKGISCICLDG